MSIYTGDKKVNSMCKGLNQDKIINPAQSKGGPGSESLGTRLDPTSAHGTLVSGLSSACNQFHLPYITCCLLPLAGIAMNVVDTAVDESFANTPYGHKQLLTILRLGVTATS